MGTMLYPMSNWSAIFQQQLAAITTEFAKPKLLTDANL